MPKRMRRLREQTTPHEAYQRFLLVPSWKRPSPRFLDYSLREAIYRLGFDSAENMTLHCCAPGDTTVANGVCLCEVCEDGGDNQQRLQQQKRGMFRVSAYHLLLPLVQREYGRYVPGFMLWA